MTIYLFDHAKALIGELDNVLSYEQTQVLGGKISAEITAVYSKLVEDAHYFGSKDVDNPNIFWMYRVTSEKKRSGQVELTGIHLLFDELQAKTIRDIRPTNLDPATALSRILQNTAWEVGIQQATGIASSNYYYQSNLSAFWDYLKKWRVEFKPRLTFSNGQITGRYIDIYNNMSANYGKRYEYGGELITVEAEQANENIYTALIGLGKGEETGDGFGRKINFSEVVWSTANGDPVNKPIGQDYVELPGATAIYGFREAVIDFSDIEDRAELLQATYLELLNVSRPKVEFSSSAIETGIVELGETITIIRDDMGIRYQTRVFELVRNFLDKTVKSFRFGDRIITSSAERIRYDREKTENKIKEQQSLLVAVRNQITDAYWGSDGYNYDLEVGNSYGLPAGLYSFDRPIDQNPTEVIYIGAGKALIANSKDVNGQWEWRTALTAEGFAGDQVVTGSITANKLAADVGQSLDLSSNVAITSKVSREEVYTEIEDYIEENKESLKGEPGEPGQPGQPGLPGEPGQQGQSLIKSTPEYYLSTSSTTQTGGSWSTAMPAWQKDRFLWMRLKNDFINPTETKYTTPVLDNVNNALNQIYDSGIILPAAKPNILLKMTEIEEEYQVYANNDAAKNSPYWSAYSSAVSQLLVYLGDITANMNATTEVDLEVFESKFSDYAESVENLRDDLEKTFRSLLGQIAEIAWDTELKVTPEAITQVISQSKLFADKSVENAVSALQTTLAGFDASVTNQRINDLGETLEEITNFFKFEGNTSNPIVAALGPYTELGTTEDQLKLRQFRNRIAFMEGEVTTGYIEGEAIHIKESHLQKLAFPHYEFINEEGSDELEGYYNV